MLVTPPEGRTNCPPRIPKQLDPADSPANILRSAALSPRPIPPSATRQVHLLYVAITRAKRLVLLNNELSRQLSSLHLWDSLSVRGLDSDAALGLPVRCCNCENIVRTGAENVDGDPDGTARRQKLVCAGSMSKKIVCQTCVEGDGGEGGRVSFFPYASELLRRGV